MKLLPTLFLQFLLVPVVIEGGRRSDALVKDWSLHQCGKEKGIYSTGKNYCCNCDGGYRKVEDCEFGKPQTTKCEACAFDSNNPNNQTYTAGPNHDTECKHSINMTLCQRVRNVHWVPGSVTQSSKCECDHGYFSNLDVLMKYGCNLHSPCEEGHEPLFVGNTRNNTKCHPCPSGTYSNETSPTEKCHKFSECMDDEQIVVEGTPISDVRCARINKTETSKDESNNAKDGTYISRTVTGVILSIVVVVALLVLFGLHKKVCTKRNQRQTIDYSKGAVSTSKHLASNQNQDRDVESGKVLQYEKDEEDSASSLSVNPECCNSVNEMVDGQLDYSITNEQQQSAVNRVQLITKESYSLKGEIRGLDIGNDPKFEETMERLLKDSVTGHEIIKSWLKTPYKNLRAVVRMFLTDLQVDDIVNENPGDCEEVRYQWLRRIREVHSTDLTPEYLLEQNYEMKIFRDVLLSAFVDCINKAMN